MSNNFALPKNEMMDISFTDSELNNKFYVYDLKLSEQVGELFHAEAVLLTPFKIKIESLLNRDLQTKISLKQIDAKDSRFVSGYVTHVQQQGVITGVNAQGTQISYYRFVITIEPKLAVLKYTVRNRSYNDCQVSSVFQKVVKDEHDIPYSICGNTLAKQYQKGCIYNQNGISDYDFIQFLLKMYGVSFIFKFDDSFEPKLFFTEGEGFSTVKDKKKDKDNEAEIKLKMVFQGEDKGGVERFQINSQPVFENFVLQESYPNSNESGSSNWYQGKKDQLNYSYEFDTHFHGYNRSISHDEVNKDVALILEARKTAEKCKAIEYEGVAQELDIIPGRLFALSGFRGKDDKSTILGRVIKTDLHARANWPSEYIRPFEVEQVERPSEQKIVVKFSAIDFSEKQRYCR
ncbi:MAG: phage late control D family protein [Alphaproteobacteria bacterium]|nr:phage late control D family protein [Alphaproteobacteria bacterium]